MKTTPEGLQRCPTANDGGSFVLLILKFIKLHCKASQTASSEANGAGKGMDIA